jgi:hypothetical protein
MVSLRNLLFFDCVPERSLDVVAARRS